MIKFPFIKRSPNNGDSSALHKQHMQLDASPSQQKEGVVPEIFEYRRRGDEARDQKSWESAVENYREYLKSVPSDFDIWVQLGHALKESSDFRGAEGAYSKAEALKVDDPDLLLNIGRLHASQGNNRVALEYLRRSYHSDGNVHSYNIIKEIVGEAPDAVLGHLDEMHLDVQMKKVLDSGFFDPNWYLAKYPDIQLRFEGPLSHFMRHGAYEWRSPGPHFDLEWYLFQNPDLIPAANARLLNPLLHYIEFGAAEGRLAAPPMSTTTRTIVDVVQDIIDIDPLMYSQDSYILPKSLKVNGAILKNRATEAFARAFNSISKNYDYVITVPWLVHGGAELMALHFARAIVALHGEKSVLVVAVDYARDDARDWLPAGVDFLMLQSQGNDMPARETTETVLFLVQALAPKMLINVNSLATWEMIKLYGHAIKDTKLYACAFCRDYNAHGYPAGYADTHVRECLAHLHGLLSDNRSFFGTLEKSFGIPPLLAKKFVTFYNPTPESAPEQRSDALAIGKRRAADDARPFTVCWASRFTKQKNIDLLAQIVRQAPEIKFEAWGRGELSDRLTELAKECANFSLRGHYASFRSIPVDSYDVFLYTSLWDGIPNVLLEAASIPLPIVTANVGGIGELVDDSTGWLIDDLHSPRGYIDALRQVRDDTGLVRAKSKRMRARLSMQHSWDQFVATMRSLEG